MACGLEDGVELEAVSGSPTGARRGKHVDLDAARDLELALETLLRLGRRLQILDVGLQRIAHAVKGGSEGSDLVGGANCGKSPVEVAVAISPALVESCANSI